MSWRGAVDTQVKWNSIDGIRDCDALEYNKSTFVLSLFQRFVSEPWNRSFLFCFFQNFWYASFECFWSDIFCDSVADIFQHMPSMSLNAMALGINYVYKQHFSHLCTILDGFCHWAHCYTNWDCLIKDRQRTVQKFYCWCQFLKMCV